MDYLSSNFLDMKQDLSASIVADALKSTAIEEISSCKERFIKYNETALLSKVPDEIARSWVRAKQNGVDPFMAAVPHRLRNKELSALLRDKQGLIDDVLSLIYNSTPFISNCAIALIDREGIVLAMAGDKNIIRRLQEANHCIGAIWNEESVGTTAHTLSISLGKPVQISKASHYCTNMINDHTLASSAPLIDHNGDVIGALVAIHWLNGDLLKLNNKSTLMNPLGWVISITSSYHHQAVLKHQNYKFSLINQMLESGLAVTKTGFLTMDQQGIIKSINNEGCNLTGLDATEIIGKRFSDLFANASWVINRLGTNKSIERFKTTLTNGRHKKQLVFNFLTSEVSQEAGVAGALMHVCSDETHATSQRNSFDVRYCLDDIVSNSKTMKRAIHSAKIMAQNSENILIVGESGTGKEVFAQSIHNLYCPEGPFVAINCAAIPKSLIESELFGYEGGSFTGAERKGRIGKIELAQGGTLFLDEIGDMPLELQPVLLRVLEEKRFMRVGGSRYIPAQVRVIAATNKDLHKLIEEEKFREDLYYRLAIFKIRLPALRERKEDIDLLIEHLSKQICQEHDCPLPEFSPKAIETLRKYHWPGNIRQLKNVLCYAISMSQGEVVQVDHLPEELIANYTVKKSSSTKGSLSGPMSMREAEIQAIRNALDYTNNNLNDAAQVLGIGRTTMYRKLKEYQISIH